MTNLFDSSRTDINHNFSTEKRFSDEFKRAMIISEKLRSVFLIVLAGIGLFIGTISFFIAKDTIDDIAGFEVPPRFLLGLMAIFLMIIAYEFVINRMIVRVTKKHPVWLTIIRYSNAFEETSLPTILIVIMANIYHPLEALLIPPVSLYFMFIILSAFRLDFKLSLFTGAVAAIEYLAVAFYFLGQAPIGANIPEFWLLPFAHIERAGLFFMGGLIAGTVTIQIKHWITSTVRSVDEQNRVLNLFGQHVSVAVVDKLLSQRADMGSEVRYVCMMFLDIRDFTTFSEKKTPEDVVNYLNRLFDFMIEIVNKNHGVINKFLGDGFMAVFGAPFSDGEDCQNALTASLAIIERIEAEIAAGVIPPTTVGIGLHAGQAVTGNVGSSLRKEYTVIGDVVNLASRIEQLNKQFKSQLLVSETVWHSIKEGDREAKSLGPVKVKGRDTPVEIYQLV